ncbi:MAG: hypothetical protein V1818_00335 [Candidatus Aenigmatarchaeota archaeon]
MADEKYYSKFTREIYPRLEPVLNVAQELSQNQEMGLAKKVLNDFALKNKHMFDEKEIENFEYAGKMICYPYNLSWRPGFILEDRWQLVKGVIIPRVDVAPFHQVNVLYFKEDYCPNNVNIMNIDGNFSLFIDKKNGISTKYHKEYNALESQYMKIHRKLLEASIKQILTKV